MLEQVKAKWLEKVNNALEKGVSADTLGLIGETLARFEHNEILKAQRPLDYERVVNDVKDVVKELPIDTQKELI